MNKRMADASHYSRTDLNRAGVVATAWAVFYVLLLTSGVSGSNRHPLTAGIGGPDWRTAAADFARLPDPPAPIRDAFAR